MPGTFQEHDLAYFPAMAYRHIFDRSAENTPCPPWKETLYCANNFPPCNIFDTDLPPRPSIVYHRYTHQISQSKASCHLPHLPQPKFSTQHRFAPNPSIEILLRDQR